MHANASSQIEPLHTLREILQQPEVWPTTLTRVEAAAAQYGLRARLNGARVLFTGAGTSAYAARSIASAWPGSLAVPTTDLLLDAERYLYGVDAVISLARSGNSPESAAVVERIRALRPDIFQFAILCNEENALSNAGLDGCIVLDPRTNDRSLVMTSAFSNLVLAALSLAQPEATADVVKKAVQHLKSLFPAIDSKCRQVATHVCKHLDSEDRIVVLSSSPLQGWGNEASLKALEMTAGRFPVVAETYLGLRHGPMSFVRPKTFVLCLLSSDPVRRLYEFDLIQELRAKNLGYLVGIAEASEAGNLFDEVVPAVLPQASDELRTPFEIVVPQLIGYHLSLGIGLNPDNPSPDGIINRVVQGVRIHPANNV
jgi:tagatose-6-phosphate ketose/aldose isomerase